MHVKIPKKEVRGSCRRPQRELLSRISTREGLAQGLARLQTIFNWLWAQWLSLVFPCHSDSLENWERPREVHDKPKPSLEA